MPSDFTEAQKALIEKIATDAAEKAIKDADYLKRHDVKRRHDTKGALAVPDSEVVEDIALRVVETWAKAKPKWWEFRRRLDMVLVSGGIAALGIFAVYDAAVKGWTRIPEAIHWVAGTDKKIEREVIEVVTNWRNGRTSPVTDAFKTAFEEQLGRWSEGEVFGRRSKDALETLARQTRASDNPLLGFVKQALKANPLLMFHEQGVLGNRLPVQISDHGCERLFAHWYDNRRESLPAEIASKERSDALQDVCNSVAELRQGTTIEVPFFARFHKDEAGLRDQVMLVLHVTRHKLEAALPLDNAVSQVAEGSVALAHSFDTLEGLVIEYHSTNVNLIREGRDTIQIPFEKLPAQGNRFHAGFIDETVRVALPAPATGRLNNQDLIHSISVSLPEDHDGTELVQVRLMVMVNKEVF